MSTATPTVVTEFEVEVEVRKVHQVADEVVELTLALPVGGALPDWTPGAHVDLILDEDLVRQYSLCSSPRDPSEYRVAVLRAPDSRGGSVRVHQLDQGQALRIRGPRNHFPLVTAPRYLFVAGGIGVTPILPMIEEVEAAGAEWHLWYGGRTRSSMAYLSDLEAYGDRVTVVPQDEAGLLDLDAALGTPAPGTLVYCCGPEPLLAAVEERCAVWPPGSLHLERFAAKAVEREGEDAPFELVLQASGVTTTVPADKSVFEVMRECGVSVLGSCLEGICGTCETDVVDGEVDHRDSVLDEEERASNETMMVCVSRCHGQRLILDA